MFFFPRIMQLAGSKERSCPDRPCDNELRATDPRLPAAVSHNSAPDTPDADAEAAEVSTSILDFHRMMCRRSGLPQSIWINSVIALWHHGHLYQCVTILPIGSMVLEYVPTFARTKSPSFVGKYTIHGAYGL